MLFAHIVFLVILIQKSHFSIANKASTMFRQREKMIQIQEIGLKV